MNHPQAILTRVTEIASDPFEFIRTCVFTRDEVDKNMPIKPAPHELNYVRLFCRIFERKRLILVPKSRRMWVTWLCLSLFLWDTMFNRIRANFIVSKKEDDANQLLDRVEFIIRNIPEQMIPKDIIPKYNRKFCLIEFPNLESYLKAIPSGKDQLRQYTASGLFFDEFAFWDNCEETYGAALPTIEGGGRAVICSTPPENASPHGSFFERLCFDRLHTS